MKPEELYKNNLEESNSPLLNKIGKEHGFEVPDGYFNELSSSIQNRISSLNKKKDISIFNVLVKPQFIAAYTVAVLIGLIIIFNPISKVENIITDNNSYNSLLAEQIMYSADFDESTIISAITESDISSDDEIGDKAISMLGSEEELSSDEIIEYLASEDLGELALYLSN